LVELESDINLDEALFKRVQAVHDQRESLGPEERMLTEKIWLSFKRGGGLLNEEGKAKLRAIDTELSTLGPQCSANVLKSEVTGELSVRAKVGYGGGDFTVAGGHVYFAAAHDGRIYKQSLKGGRARGRSRRASAPPRRLASHLMASGCSTFITTRTSR